MTSISEQGNAENNKENKKVQENLSKLTADSRLAEDDPYGWYIAEFGENDSHYAESKKAYEEAMTKWVKDTETVLHEADKFLHHTWDSRNCIEDIYEVNFRSQNLWIDAIYYHDKHGLCTIDRYRDSLKLCITQIDFNGDFLNLWAEKNYKEKYGKDERKNNGMEQDCGSNYQFVSEEHENFYHQHESFASKGMCHAALVYTLGIDESCRTAWNQCVDERLGVIRPEALYAGWQTTGSLGITRLAFQLYTCGTPDIEENGSDNDSQYTVTNIFRGLDETHRRGAILAIGYFA